MKLKEIIRKKVIKCADWIYSSEYGVLCQNLEKLQVP
jgi:hypothetical protein